MADGRRRAAHLPFFDIIMQLSSRQHMRQLFVSREKDVEVSQTYSSHARGRQISDVPGIAFRLRSVALMSAMMSSPFRSTSRYLFLRWQSVFSTATPQSHLDTDSDAAHRVRCGTRARPTDNTSSGRLRTVGNFSLQDLLDSANIGPRRERRDVPHCLGTVFAPCREGAPKR